MVPRRWLRLILFDPLTFPLGKLWDSLVVSTTIGWITFKFGTVDCGIQDIHPHDFSDSMTSSGTALSLTGAVQMFIILLDFIFPLTLDLVPYWVKISVCPLLWLVDLIVWFSLQWALWLHKASSAAANAKSCCFQVSAAFLLWKSYFTNSLPVIWDFSQRVHILLMVFSWTHQWILGYFSRLWIAWRNLWTKFTSWLIEHDLERWRGLCFDRIDKKYKIRWSTLFLGRCDQSVCCWNM